MTAVEHVRDLVDKHAPNYRKPDETGIDCLERLLPDLLDRQKTVEDECLSYRHELQEIGPEITLLADTLVECFPHARKEKETTLEWAARLIRAFGNVKQSDLLHLVQELYQRDPDNKHGSANHPINWATRLIDAERAQSQQNAESQKAEIERLEGRLVDLYRDWQSATVRIEQLNEALEQEARKHAMRDKMLNTLVDLAARRQALITPQIIINVPPGTDLPRIIRTDLGFPVGQESSDLSPAQEAAPDAHQATPEQ